MRINSCEINNTHTHTKMITHAMANAFIMVRVSYNVREYVCDDGDSDGGNELWVWDGGSWMGMMTIQYM